MIGQRVRRIRLARGKSLRAAAGLARMGRLPLQRIETGECIPTLPEIVVLAEALQIAPSELLRLPLTALADGLTESAIEAVRRALAAVDIDHPAGLVLPLAVLRDQVARVHAQRRACRFAEVATELPGLICDLHTTLATGRDRDALLELVVYLHVHVTRLWLAHAAAPTDLIRNVAFLARRLAKERDDVSTLGMAGFGVVAALQTSGEFELGRLALDSLPVPPTTAETAGLVCNLTLCHAHAAVLNGRPDDAAAPLKTATELTERFGTTRETDSLGFVHSLVDVALHQMQMALEAGEPDEVVRIAHHVDPGQHPFLLGRAQYWRSYGCGLAQLGGRHDEAVRALRTAESIFPAVVHRDPRVRDVLAMLLARWRRDAVGRELRAMASRAGLPV